MNHPYVTMKLGLGSDKRNIDSIYPLSLFFAFGIYLVFDRYQKRYNSAVPFQWTHPDVGNFLFASFMLRALIYDNRRRIQHGKQDNSSNPISNPTSGYQSCFLPWPKGVNGLRRLIQLLVCTLALSWRTTKMKSKGRSGALSKRNGHGERQHSSNADVLLGVY